MSFEEFEQILMICGEVKFIGTDGSDDWEVTLWRCYGNDNCCQVRRLYDAVCKSIALERERARLQGERDALLKLVLEGRGKTDGERG